MPSDNVPTGVMIRVLAVPWGAGVEVFTHGVPTHSRGGVPLRWDRRGENCDRTARALDVFHGLFNPGFTL